MLPETLRWERLGDENTGSLWTLTVALYDSQEGHGDLGLHPQGDEFCKQPESFKENLQCHIRTIGSASTLVSS